MRSQQHPRNTSLLLILLTLAAGMALGWLLRDLIGQRDRIDPVPVAEATHVGITVSPVVVPATPAVAATATRLPPTDTPVPTSTPNPTDTPVPTSTPIVVAYHGYRVRPGDTLAAIAQRSGSSPEAIAAYNLLPGEPPAGRDLIIPRFDVSADVANESLLVVRGAAERPWVALTLDAGASAAPVPLMLETLRRRGVTITFFLTGDWIRRNPELARAIVADGHEIANHTVTHPDLRQLDDDAIAAELRETDRLMREITGVGTRPFFRPPFGAYDDRVLQVVQREGYLSIYWTLDSLDSVGEPKTPAFLVERITNHLSVQELHGAIILAHCGSEATAAALPEILDRFAAMGLEVRRLSDVLPS
ncbi:MAG TPA: polysaccharide deacetylase family protein [Roseiflexaceae bacterium]|nr:polysaccharide deacetylase family protein [Roseiflexaceae bacterium]HMP41229.1 polysaccharide deacetylase family protein [Roseiflexaceae bacterium]